MRKTNFPSESNITLNISSFSKGLSTILDKNLTPINYAYDIKNFAFSDGALKNGVGFKELLPKIISADYLEQLQRDFEAIGSIERVFHFYIYNQDKEERQDKLVFVNSEYKLFYIDLYSQTPSLNSIRNITFTSIPVAKQYRLNGEDVLILSSISDNMVVWNGSDEPYEVLDAPKISSMALHYERLFVTVDGEKAAVWFSDDLDPTNWSISLEEAGFIELIDERGALLKVVSFCDYLYIFREYGISRLSAYGNQSSFAVSNLFVSSGKIFENSVCVCGDKIIFLASDGLYKFDGVDTVKILDNISNNLINLNNKNISSCYYNGSYYLACKFNFEKDDKNTINLFHNNALLEIDINSYSLKNITYGIDIKHISTLQTDKFSGVIAITKDENANEYTPTIITSDGLYLDEPLVKVWASPTTGVDKTHNLKTLKKIYLESEGEVIITILHDNNQTSFTFDGHALPIIKRVNIPLYNFGFKIVSNDKRCNIKNLKFLFSSVNGRE